MLLRMTYGYWFDLPGELHLVSLALVIFQRCLEKYTKALIIHVDLYHLYSYHPQQGTIFPPTALEIS